LRQKRLTVKAIRTHQFSESFSDAEVDENSDSMYFLVWAGVEFNPSYSKVLR
jgi:hypothetical protein